jgi:hypothetical protein
LGELLDRVTDLLVEHPTVRHDDHRVEDRLTALLDPDELVGQPGDRIALAATCRVLDEVTATGVVLLVVGQELSDDVELVVAGEDLDLALASRALVLLFHHLGIVLDDVGQPFAGEDRTP